MEYSTSSNPSDSPLSSSQITTEDVLPQLDSIRKWIRELHDELICARAEAVNEADPQTALSKLSYTTEDIDELVQQLEEATSRIQIVETQLEEKNLVSTTKEDELMKLRAELRDCQSELAAKLEATGKGRIAFQK